MKYLFNLVKHQSKLGLFDEKWEDVNLFLKDHNLQGIEIMFYHDYNIEKIPKEIVHGMHMLYWPTWIDFWRENDKELLSQFGSKDNIEMYYGSLRREVLIDHYNKEFKVAQDLSVDYMVFHVSHVQLDHIYKWNFSYTDEEVMNESAQLINSVFGNKDKGVTLLFENLWWPGLNFKDPNLTENFLEKIHYPNKGFILDIGHLMITNPYIKNLDEACDYIEKVIKMHKGIMNNIHGIHLNQSLTGKYLRTSHIEKFDNMKNKEFWDNLADARYHISEIDTHVPFDHKGIKKIIDIIDPKYIVFEFLPKDLEELELMISHQNMILDR